jgi:phage baseplate assembly protein W
MTGLSRTTAEVLPFADHLAQSIGDILSTPIGSRVLRRTYGSNLPRLIDAPINGETAVDLYMATAEAIDLWEPRFLLRRVAIEEAVQGRLSLSLTGEVAGADAVINVTVAA